MLLVNWISALANGPLVDPELYASCVRVATPIALAAMGATICERSGVMNIGLEGSMLCAAFAATFVAIQSGSAEAGVFAAIAVGAAVGFVLAASVLFLRAEQIVAGIALNIAALGLTSFLMPIVYGTPGLSPAAPGLDPIDLPVLSTIPWLGVAFFQQTPIVYATVLLAGLLHVVLFRTPIGLRLRATGNSPQAARSVGVNVAALRLGALVASGALAGLAGANLSLEVAHHFAEGMTNGRGFIALAANILGQWTPLGSLASSVVFGFADALGLRQNELVIPPEVILSLPYVVTIVVLAISAGRRSRAPRALGQPFEA